MLKIEFRSLFVNKQYLALPLAAAALASLAAAQTPTKVGVIQIQSALVSTKDGQKAVQDLETRMVPKQKEMERKRTEIQELQDKLNKGGNAMAQTAKDDLARSIDQKTKSYNRDMEDTRAELETEQRKILEELSGKMQVVIDKYASANGYAVIMDVSNPNTPVLYVSSGVDITKDIIDLYDKTQPSAPSIKPTSAPTTSRPATQTPAAPRPNSAAPTTTPKKQP